MVTLQLRVVVRRSGKGIAADRHVENVDQRGVSRVLVKRRMQTGQIPEIRRAVQQREAPDVGRDQHAVHQTSRTAVLRRLERTENQQSQQPAPAAGPGRFQDDAPRRGIPRTRGYRHVGRFWSVHGPRFHPNGHAWRYVLSRRVRFKRKN